jgi:hypothetical protein
MNAEAAVVRYRELDEIPRALAPGTLALNARLAALDFRLLAFR